jgi:hypothetical protein
MPVNWEYYVKRRRINVIAWLKSKKIHTYKDLVEECKRKSIVPPHIDLIKESLDAVVSVPDLQSQPRSVSKPESFKPKQVPKRRLPDEPKPKPIRVPTKAPTRTPPARPKKVPVPIVTAPEPKLAPPPKVPEPKPIVKEPEKSVEQKQVVKQPEKIVWNFMMRKAELLKLADSVGLDDLSIKSTKAQIVGALVKAGYPESQA